MVAYHVMDYFALGHPDLYEYLHFVSGAFIFVTGYIIASLYKDKYDLDRQRICKRLIMRGLKLLAVFTGANLIINSLQLQNFNKMQFGLRLFLDNLIPIYVYGSGRLATFEVLLPLAYLLILSPVLLVLSGRFQRYVTGAIVLLLVACWVLQVRVTGLSLINVGLVGFMVGTLTLTTDLTSRWSQIINTAGLLLFLLMLPFIPHNFITYSCNIVLMLKFAHDLAQHINLRKSFNRMVVLFGQYSLVCYLAQIAFLQILYRFVLQQRWNMGYELLLIAVATCMFLAVGCLMLEDRSRLIAHKL
jgi:peptidoglycan/LPS O-acetylase OafA/YrhL